jgi:hypothetical protein
VPAVVLGGVKVADVSFVIAAPPVVLLVVLLYHWYVVVPVPLAAATVKFVGVPPTHIVCVASGCVLTVGGVNT